MANVPIVLPPDRPKLPLSPARHGTLMVNDQVRDRPSLADRVDDTNSCWLLVVGGAMTNSSCFFLNDKTQSLKRFQPHPAIQAASVLERRSRCLCRF
ncbi:MAG: hypothetical protein H7Z11_11010 [Verrucomicrobia bacterium]|nr:hypothetical protein [Leptolyngbya sp. ES-bin-22]